MFGATQNNELLFNYMKKRSQNKKTITRQSYKYRWFVLTHESLSYYDGNIEKRGNRKGEIFLNSIRGVEEVENLSLDLNNNVFQVVYLESNDCYTLYIVAETKRQRETWIQALRLACKDKHSSFFQKYHPGVWTKSLDKYTCCDQIDRKAPGCELSFIERHDDLPSIGKHSSSSHLGYTPSLTSAENFEKTYIAIYNFKPMAEGDLQLFKGERYEVLDNSLEHWWVAKSKNGKTGYIPSTYVRKLRDLEIYDWYYKDITRQKCEEYLRRDGRDGCFMVRDSTTPRIFYTVSLYANGKPRHYHVKQNDKKFYLSERCYFSTVPELVNYHKHNAAGLETRLHFPPRHGQRTAPTTAGFGHDHWEIDPSELVRGKELGTGCFGTVYEAWWKDNIVAIKLMKTGSMSEHGFIEEAKTMTQLSHPNLVQLYGVVTKQQPLIIITEFMMHGSLWQFLKSKVPRILNETERLIMFCVDVCKGMEYLESRKCIHRDLAARNCLVGQNYVVKVGDFGLARHVIDDEYSSSYGAKFPIKWAAPEVLKYTRFSSKSDVWAFGVLIWEIFSGGQLPFANITNADVVEIICNKDERLKKPIDCPQSVFTQMMNCWARKAEDRPSFKILLSCLHAILEST